MSDYDRRREEERRREDERRRQEERRRQNQRQGGGGGGGGGGGCVSDPKYYATKIGIFKIVALAVIIVAFIFGFLGRHHCPRWDLPSNWPGTDYIAKSYTALCSLDHACFGLQQFLICIAGLFLLIMFILGFFLNMRNDRTWKKADKLGHLVAGIVVIVAAVLFLLHWICFLASFNFRFGTIYGSERTSVITGYADEIGVTLFTLICFILTLAEEIVAGVFCLLIYCAL